MQTRVAVPLWVESQLQTTPKCLQVFVDREGEEEEDGDDAGGGGGGGGGGILEFIERRLVAKKRAAAAAAAGQAAEDAPAPSDDGGGDAGGEEEGEGETQMRRARLVMLLFRKDARGRAARHAAKAAAREEPLEVPELNEAAAESLSELVTERLESVERIVHGAAW